jgi:transketolase
LQSLAVEMSFDPALNQNVVTSLEYKSIQYRKTILRIIRAARAGHTGGSLSCIDILNVLYNQIMDINPGNFAQVDRDHYIHSKGHSVEALYTVLADKGFFPPEELETMEQYGSHFIGHPTRHVPGIEHNTGSLGHGLATAVGLALAGKKDNRSYRVFVVLGDGELTEGSVWEAAMSATNFGLDNLTAIIDRNRLQITGPTESVMRLEPLDEKFRAFGFAVRHASGNDVASLLENLQNLPFERGKPNLIIANTTKGRGVHFMEDQVSWHHRVPTEEEYALAMQELQQAEEAWQRQNGEIHDR